MITSICNPAYQRNESDVADPETGWQYKLHNMKFGNCGYEFEIYDSIIPTITSPTVKGLT